MIKPLKLIDIINNIQVSGDITTVKTRSRANKIRIRCKRSIEISTPILLEEIDMEFDTPEAALFHNNMFCITEI